MARRTRCGAHVSPCLGARSCRKEDGTVTGTRRVACSSARKTQVTACSKITGLCSNSCESLTMRDDFSDEVKRTLAARAGGVCSNPDCRASTSGPQDDPAKALNVGVAAHITGAAKGGARYDAELSTEERRHPDNGIWLCQTCAKLVDNDATRFSVELLLDWKEGAEERARSSIGKTVATVAESESQRKLRYILPWKGKTIKLSEVNTGKAAMLLGPVRGSAFVQLLNCTEFYVSVGKTGEGGWSGSIPLVNLEEICFDEAHDCLELQYRNA